MTKRSGRQPARKKHKPGKKSVKKTVHRSVPKKSKPSAPKKSKHSIFRKPSKHKRKHPPNLTGKSFGRAKSKGKITFKYYNRFGRQVRTVGDASEIRFYRGGKRYGRAYPAMEARMFRAEYQVVKPITKETPGLGGYSSVFEGGWNPKKELLYNVLVKKLGKRFSGIDVGNIVVTVGSEKLGLRTMAEVTVRDSWKNKSIRGRAYQNLIYHILQNVRSAGGNTSSDRLKTAGEIGASSKGYPLPDDYTIEVWVRDKKAMRREISWL